MPDLGKAYVQIVPSAEGITGAIEKLLGGEAEKAGKSAGSKIAAGIGAAAAAGTAAVVAFGVQAVQTGSAFDAAMSQVAATMGKTMADMENEVGTVDLAWGTFSGNLREYAQEMGANTAFSATQAAEALNYMALAGYDTATSMAMLPNVLSLAAAGSMDLARASDMITDTQTAFGISLERTTQLVDEMAKAASTGNTSVEQLGDAFLTVGGLAAELNGGIVYLADGTEVATDGVQELEIALTAMANAGVKGSEAGTHMRNMILKLVSPTNAGAAAMEALNLDVFDAQGNMNSLSSIMEQLAIGMHDLSQEQKLIYISDLFNARDVASAEALLGAIEQDWDAIGASILEAQGSAQKMADTQLDNLAGDVTLLKSAFEGVQIAVSDQLTPSLREFATFGQEALSSIGAAIQEGGLMAGIQELGNQLAGAATMILEHLPEIADAGLQLVTSLVTSILEYLGTHTEEVVTAGVQLLGSLLNSTTEIVDAIVKNLPGIIDGIVSALTKQENLDKITDGGVDLFFVLLDNTDEILKSLVNGVADLVVGLVGLITGKDNEETTAEGGKTLMECLDDRWASIDFDGEALKEAIWNAVKKYAKSWWELGGWIMEQIWSGMKNLWSNMLSPDVISNDWTNFHKTQPEEYAGAGAGREAAQAFTTPTSRAQVFRAEETAFQAGLSAGGGGGDTYNVTIDAKSVKEFNDIVDIAQNARRERRMATA